MSTPVRSSSRTLAVALGVLIVVFVGLALLPFVPPRSMGALPPTLAAAELSPLLAVAALITAIAVLVLMRRAARLRAVGLLALCLTIALLLAPLWALAEAMREADAAIATIRPVRSPVAADSSELARGGPGAVFAAALRGLPSTGDVTERTIPYTAADGSPLGMRLFRGAVPGARPTVVVIYGGAWRGGTTDQTADASRYLAHLGYTVVAIDHRHAPRFPHPAQIDDVRRSIAVIADSAAGWGIDTARVAFLGRSSGGHLAMLAAFAPNPGAPFGPRAVIAYYAPFDLEEGYTNLPQPDPIDVRTQIRNLVGGTPDEVPARYREASPSTYVRAGLPPTLLVYAANDHIVKAEFGRNAASRLREMGDPVVYTALPGAEHGFDMVPRGMRGRVALHLVERFLARTL